MNIGYLLVHVRSARLVKEYIIAIFESHTDKVTIKNEIYSY